MYLLLLRWPFLPLRLHPLRKKEFRLKKIKKYKQMIFLLSGHIARAKAL